MVVDDIITLFSHEKNKSCEDIKASIRGMSGSGILSRVVARMVEEGFRLVPNVEIININNEMNKEGHR